MRRVSSSFAFLGHSCCKISSCSGQLRQEMDERRLAKKPPSCFGKPGAFATYRRHLPPRNQRKGQGEPGSLSEPRWKRKVHTAFSKAPSSGPAFSSKVRRGTSVSPLPGIVFWSAGAEGGRDLVPDESCGESCGPRFIWLRRVRIHDPMIGLSVCWCWCL